ncbi:MAG: hypothetical protein HY391_01525 [Deltaproteobacteria bacterium]|nr:hypothetical protein [Deltaproteobacteria bacterium]
MLTCQDVNKLMAQYMEKKISLHQRILFKLHLWMCEHCSQHLEQFEKNADVMKKRPPTEAPKDLSERLGEVFEEYQICPICQKEVRFVELHAKAERQILEIIRRDHPEWIEKNGLCPPCLEYYRQELERQQ